MWFLFYSSVALLVLLMFVIFLRRPSQESNWVPEHSVLASADINGGEIVLNNIISADYTAPGKCIVEHYDKSFNITDVDSAWLLVENFHVYAGPIKINLSHAFLTFGFKDETFISISVAGRRKLGEVVTFARIIPHRNEIIYKVIDEADTLYARCVHDNDEVKLYKLRATPDLSQKILLNMLGELNKLHRKPKWFDSLTRNCSTEIIKHLKDVGFKLPLWHPSYIATTGIDELLQKFGVIESGNSIMQKVQDLGKDPELSRKIRE